MGARDTFATQTGHETLPTVTHDAYITGSAVRQRARLDWRSSLLTFGADRMERGDPTVLANVGVVVCLGDPDRTRAGHRRSAEPTDKRRDPTVKLARSGR